MSEPVPAIISEHEGVAIGKKEDSKESPASENTVKMVTELLSRAKRKRKAFDTRWPEFYDFFKGKQWPIERPRWRFSEAINICWSTIWTTVSIMTDNRPQVEYAPAEPTDTAWTDNLAEVQKINWEKYDWDFVLTDTILDSNVYDAGHAIVEWDPELENGLGDICFETLDPFYCYPDPAATDVNSPDSRYFIYAKPMPTSVVKEMFPDKAEEIKPDVSQIGLSFDRTMNADPVMFRDPDNAARPGGSSLGTDYGGENMTLLVRCWLKDGGLEQEEKEHGGLKEFVLKKKYPKGRYIVIANNKVLQDGPNGVMINGKIEPYEDGKFPIAKLVDHSFPRQYWGEGEIGQLKGPQKILNYVWSYILDHIKIAGNPQTILQHDSGVEADQLTNEPGLVIETSNMASIRREPGEPLPGGILNVLEEALRFPDKVSGVQDVTRGAMQPGITSGLMLEGFIEAAQTRIRLKNRYLDKFLRNVGYLMLSRMLQFYTAPRLFRILNKEGLPQFVEFFVSTDQNGKKLINFNITDTNGPRPVSRGTQAEVKGIPDVRVVSGSALPFARAQKAATALNLYNAQGIDREELLKATNWPNWEEVLRRMEEKEAQMAQMQAQQGGTNGA